MFEILVKVTVIAITLTAMFFVVHYFYAVFAATDMFTLVKSFMQFAMMIFIMRIIGKIEKKL